MIDPGNAYLRSLFGGKNSMKRQRDTVSWRAVDRPMMIIHLANPERAGERETVRSAAHLSGGCDHKDFTQFAEGALQRVQPLRMDAVVICQKNSVHLSA